jgi:hypothetical protein
MRGNYTISTRFAIDLFPVIIFPLAWGYDKYGPIELGEDRR